MNALGPDIECWRSARRRVLAVVALSIAVCAVSPGGAGAAASIDAGVAAAPEPTTTLAPQPTIDRPVTVFAKGTTKLGTQWSLELSSDGPTGKCIFIATGSQRGGCASAGDAANPTRLGLLAGRVGTPGPDIASQPYLVVISAPHGTKAVRLTARNNPPQRLTKSVSSPDRRTSLFVGELNGKATDIRASTIKP